MRYRPFAYLPIVFRECRQSFLHKTMSAPSKPIFIALALTAAFLLSGCGNEAASINIRSENNGQEEVSPLSPVSGRTPVSPYMVHRPATGSRYIYDSNTTVDISNIENGYIMLRYTGNASRVVLQMMSSSSALTYTYNLDVTGNWEVFPLTMGDGVYTVNVLEHVEGQMFAVAVSTTFEVVLNNEKLPFLYPNQLVNFSENSRATALAAELAEGAKNELDVVRNIYEFVINNIVYDSDFAAAVVAGQITQHIPDLDATIASGQGICFDYAALMTGMLRAQHIPTKLITGYVSGGIFHAWINVYVPDVGWINAVRFNGVDWSLMDPTFSAAFDPTGSIAAFVGDGSGHSPLFTH